MLKSTPRLTAIWLCAAATLIASSAAFATNTQPEHSYNGLALTPPMGFNNWAHSLVSG